MGRGLDIDLLLFFHDFGCHVEVQDGARKVSKSMSKSYGFSGPQKVSFGGLPRPRGKGKTIGVDTHVVRPGGSLKGI